MKVNVTKAGHYIKVKGVLTGLDKGEQEIEDSVAKSMVESGYASEVKASPKPAAKKTEGKSTAKK